MNERLRPKDGDIPGSLSASAIRWPRSEGYDRPSRGHEVQAVLLHLSDPAPWARRQEPESASDPTVAPRLEAAPSPQAYAMSSPTASMGGRRNPIVLPQSGQAPHDGHWGCRSGGRRVSPSAIGKPQGGAIEERKASAFAFSVQAHNRPGLSRKLNDATWPRIIRWRACLYRSPEGQAAQSPAFSDADNPRIISKNMADNTRGENTRVIPLGRRGYRALKRPAATRSEPKRRMSATAPPIT